MVKLCHDFYCFTDFLYILHSFQNPDQMWYIIFLLSVNFFTFTLVGFHVRPL